MQSCSTWRTLRILAGICLSLAALGNPPARAGEPAGDDLASQVTIRRDTFGVPHILAPTEEAACFGQGYASAEDHVLVMAREYLKARGEEAAYFGEDFAANDFAMKQLHIWEGAKEGYARLAPWVQRILDHDGTLEGGGGGIDLWMALARAVGLAEIELTSQRDVQAGTRFAVDAYVNFARRAPWPEAVCSSLTEMFAPAIHRERLAGWPQHYPWIDPAGLAYFRSRVSRAQRDVELGLAVTLERFTSRAQQERALEVLRFKLDVLWQMNDVMALAYGCGADREAVA